MPPLERKPKSMMEGADLSEDGFLNLQHTADWGSFD